MSAEKRARVVEILRQHEEEMEGYAYYSSNRGVPKDEYEEIAEEIVTALTPQWAEISTAPRDGTPILVMRNNWPGCKDGVAEECTNYNTYVAAWWEYERMGEGAWICYMDSIQEPECPIEPTHWMLLPSPPGVK